MIETIHNETLRVKNSSTAMFQISPKKWVSVHYSNDFQMWAPPTTMSINKKIYGDSLGVCDNGSLIIKVKKGKVVPVLN
jgi:hypothetical protein